MRLLKLITILFTSASFEQTTAQNWLPLGTGVDDAIRTLYADTASNKLYAGGYFYNAGGIIVNHIASWNGNNWDSLASGVGINFNSVTAITGYNSEIYASGPFWNAPSIAKWDGYTWDTIAYNFGVIHQFRTINGELYAAGTYTSIGSVQAQGIAKWDGTNWSNIDNTTWPLFGGMFSITEYQGQLYLGGNFGNSSNSIRGITKWNGTSWEAVGTGLGGGGAVIVHDFIEWNNELYVAGEFCIDAGGPGNGIAKWNGTSWSDVGGGMINSSFSGCPSIIDIELFNNELWAVGYFTNAGGVPALSIAKWNGINWCGVGVDFDNQMAYRLAIYNNELYVAGSFVTANSDTVNYIAKWNGGNFVDTCGNTTDVNEYTSNDVEVSIYPNPFSTNTTFQIGGNVPFPVDLVLYNSIGQQVRREEVTESKHELYKNTLSEGIYFYSIQERDGRTITRGKVVIQ